MQRFTITRENEFADKTRPFQVLVNGSVIGQINNDESVTFTTEEKKFSVSLKIGLKGSPSIFVEADDSGGIIRLRCGSNLARVSPYLLAITSLFKPNSYLWLETVQ